MRRSSVTNSSCLRTESKRAPREFIGIIRGGKRKLGIPLQITLESTGELHSVVYSIVRFLFYLFKDDKLVINQRKCLSRGERAWKARLSQARQKISTFPSLLNLSKAPAQADGAFPAVGQGWWRQSTGLAFCCLCNSSVKTANPDFC